MGSAEQNSVLSTNQGELVLRIRGSCRDGEVLRLQSAKLLVGSGAQCAVQIVEPGVAPVQCMILRGGQGTLIRCLAPTTWLNGAPFTDAQLVPGDLLTVGPVELEVVPESLPPSVDLQLNELEVTCRGLEALEENGAGQPRTDQAELDAARRSLEEDRRVWESERDQIQQQLHENAQKLEAQFSELEAVQRSLQNDRREWERQRDDLKRQLDEETRSLAARQSELEAARQELEADRQRGESDCRQATPPAPTPAAESNAAQPKAGSAQEMIERCRRLLEAEEAAGRRQGSPETPHPAAQEASPSDCAPSQMPSRASLADAWSEQGPSEKPAARPSVVPPAEAAAPNSSEPSDHDDAIAQYMASLLERVGNSGSTLPQGGSSSRATGPRQTGSQAAAGRQPGTQSVASAPIGKAAVSLRATMPALATGKPSDPLAPRASAPERATNFSAMRALANLSAHTAINKHTDKKQAADQRSRLLVATVGLACGGFLSVMWMQTGCTDNVLLNAAAVSFIVALFWLVRGVFQETQDRLFTRTVTPETLAVQAKNPAPKRGADDAAKPAGGLNVVEVPQVLADPGEVQEPA